MKVVVKSSYVAPSVPYIAKLERTKDNSELILVGINTAMILNGGRKGDSWHDHSFNAIKHQFIPLAPGEVVTLEND